MSTLSPIAQSGFADSSSYDTHRPSYSQEAICSLLAHLQIDNLLHGRIVDLGAGTGKLTELLAAREEEFEIFAVEPHAGMRAELERKRLTRVKILEGEAERLPIRDGCANGVIVAQAYFVYFRFANDKALHEIHRVLVPGGSLAMIWNLEDYNAPRSWTPTTQWESKIKDITWRFDDNQPRFRHEKWREVFEKQLASTPFTIQAANPLFSMPLGEETFKRTFWMTKEALWERYRTLSQIAVVKGEELNQVRREVFEAMDAEDVETNEKGEIALHGHIVLAWTTAVPLGPLGSGA
ncbi:hypothetical protein MMC09_005762 [Bachmanniomyces sp. S44760]|nr:hypothetical protein [Bachmanniomyces sp. S44760]